MKTKSGLVVAVIVIVALSACATQEQPVASQADFVAMIIDYGTAVKITGFTGGSTDIRIPSRLEGLPVTAIGPSAFARRQLTSVTIPDTVTHIGATAFWHNRLSEVAIPAGVIYIGNSAFARNLIVRVSVPSGAHVGISAFDAGVSVVE